MTLAIYCAGGLGKEVLELARLVNRWEQFIFVDDITQAKEYQGQIVYRFEDVKDLGVPVEFIIASGEPSGRKALYEKVKDFGYSFTTLISPWAGISPNSVIHEGCIVWDCNISIDVKIEENVVINSKTIIGHDAVIGAHSMISASCFLGGYTQLDPCIYMGPGAMIKNRIRVGESAIISLGAVILRNVKPKAVMVGNPARKIGENETGKVFGMFD